MRRYNNYVQFLLALSQTDHSFNIYQTRMKIYIASFLFFLKMSLWTRRSCIHVCLGDGLGSYPGTWVINQLSFYLLPPCSLQTAHFSFLRISFLWCHGIYCHNFSPSGHASRLKRVHTVVAYICLGDLYSGRRSSESRSSISLFHSPLPSLFASFCHCSVFMSLGSNLASWWSTW